MELQVPALRVRIEIPHIRIARRLQTLIRSLQLPQVIQAAIALTEAVAAVAAVHLIAEAEATEADVAAVEAMEADVAAAEVAGAVDDIILTPIYLQR